MAVRRVFHVTYSRSDRRWLTRDVTGKTSKVLRRSKIKASAVNFAIKQAKSRRHIGQVVVHAMDGKIEREFTYGADPVKTKG